VSYYSLYLFYVSTGVWTQGLTLARQMPHYLSHSTSFILYLSLWLSFLISRKRSATPSPLGFYSYILSDMISVILVLQNSQGSKHSSNYLNWLQCKLWWYWIILGIEVWTVVKFFTDFLLLLKARLIGIQPIFIEQLSIGYWQDHRSLAYHLISL
jgi:hypothetical protein